VEDQVRKTIEVIRPAIQADNGDIFLKGVDHLTVEFDDLLRAPAEQVDRIVRYLDLSPTAAQLDAAIAHVDRV